MDAALATVLLPYNLVYVAIHPLQTSINIALGIYGLTSLLSHYAPPDYSIFESDPQYIDMYHRIMRTKSDNLEMALQFVFDTIKQQTIQDITRAVTNNIAQGIFAGQVFKGIGSACQYTKSTAHFAELVNNVQRAKERISSHVRSVIDKIRAIELKKHGFIQIAEKTREIIYPRVKTYEQARNLALKLINEVDHSTAAPNIGKFGVCDNKITGTCWHGDEVVIRLDYAPEKGAHLNVIDYRLGKGKAGKSFVIPIEGGEKMVK